MKSYAHGASSEGRPYVLLEGDDRHEVSVHLGVVAGGSNIAT